MSMILDQVKLTTQALKSNDNQIQRKLEEHDKIKDNIIEGL